MPVRLWPSDYEKKTALNANERNLMRNAEKSMSNGHFVMDIDPLGFSTPENKYGLLIDPNRGLLTFSVYSKPLADAEAESYQMMADLVEKRIYQRLLTAKALIVRNDQKKALAFPYKHVILFPNDAKNASLLSDQHKRLLQYSIGLGFFKTIREAEYNPRSVLKGKISIVINDRNSRHRDDMPSIFDGVKELYDPDFKQVTELQCRAIFEQLAPEYTVVLNQEEPTEVKESSVKVSDEDMLISGSESEFKTFFLDEKQVGIVNEIGRGHRVLLANAGAGKSVILLSKAFKYASMYKNEKVLLTCYNNNLADSYLFKKRCAGFTSADPSGNDQYHRCLYIMTLHKLVKKLYEECLHLRLKGAFPDEEEIRNCIRYVHSGKIEMRFKAIFIDEVQIFDPTYLELCWELFDKSEDGVFLMAGDLNQTVRQQSRRGDAPWKMMPHVKLDFTGRVRYIEENYRNSQQISDYLGGMLKYMNSRLNEYGLINDEYEYDTFGKGHSRNLVLKVRTGLPKAEITQNILTAVDELTGKYGIAYSDIAILFPMAQFKPKMYFNYSWIVKALDERGIPYSAIFNYAQSGNKTMFSKTNGIVLSTIDSSLGLDFRAVIVAGLFPYNFVYSDEGKILNLKSWNDVDRFSDVEQARVQTNMRKVFTACSRAREALYVLSDLYQGSPMEDVIGVNGEYHD